MKSARNQWVCWVWAGWETDQHYRRRGGSDTRFFGNGAWLDAWRDRLTTPETLDWLVDSGITTLVTYFYKGFGLDAEREERERLRDWIAAAHAKHLKVIGYTQGGSLYYETLLNEQPDMMNWVARHRDGALQAWSGSYYRLRPCLTNQDYLAYMQRVLDIGTQDLQLDGIHFDNNYYRHCWCERCAARFRDWLNQRDDLHRMVGLPHANHVIPPPLDRDAGAFSDPLQILWMRFGAEVRSQAYQQLIQHTRARRPEVVFAGNPAFPRRSVYLSDLALDLHTEAQRFDVLFAENGNLPQWDTKRCVSQAEAYLLADALGYGVFSTAWKSGENSVLPPQNPSEVWTIMAEEASFHAAAIGNNWMLRPAGDYEKTLGDHAALIGAFRDASEFFGSLHESLDRRQLRQWGEVGLFVEPDTLSLAWRRDRGVMRAAILALQCMRLSVVLVPSGRPVPDGVRILLVPQQTCLSDESMKQISSFARGDQHRVLVMGSSGEKDLMALPRNRSDREKWRRGTGMVCDAGEPLDWTPEQEGQQYLSTDESAAQAEAQSVIGMMLERIGFASAVTCAAPEGVLLNVEHNDRAWVIHLRDQTGCGQPMGKITLQLDPACFGRKPVWCYRPGHTSPLKLGIDADGSLVLPDWQHYAQLRLTKP